MNRLMIMKSCPYLAQTLKLYAFLLQIYFLNKRFASIKQAMKVMTMYWTVRFMKIHCFFHLNADLGRATETEVRVWDELLENMMEELPYAAHKTPDISSYSCIF